MSLVAILGSVNAACASPHPPPQPLPANLAAGAPARVWSRSTGIGLTAPAALGDSLVYVAGFDRQIYALSLATGAQRWEARMPGVVVGGVLREGNRLFAASGRPDGKVQAYDATSGRRLWKRATGDVAAPLSVVDGVLIAETRAGLVLGLDPNTGTVRWRHPIGVSRAAPLPAPDSSFVVATLDSLFRIRSRDGQVLVRRRSPGAIVDAWRVYGDRLVAGTGDSLVVALDRGTLEPAWSTRLDAPVLAAPVLAGDTLFVLTRIGTLYRVDAADGAATRIVALRWPVSAAPTSLGDLLLAGGADGTVRALRHDGSEAWRLQLWQPVAVSALALPDGMIAFSGNGDVQRYRP